MTDYGLRPAGGTRPRRPPRSRCDKERDRERRSAPFPVASDGREPLLVSVAGRIDERTWDRSAGTAPAEAAGPTAAAEASRPTAEAAGAAPPESAGTSAADPGWAVEPTRSRAAEAAGGLPWGRPRVDRITAGPKPGPAPPRPGPTPPPDGSRPPGRRDGAASPPGRPPAGPGSGRAPPGWPVPAGPVPERGAPSPRTASALIRRPGQGPPRSPSARHRAADPRAPPW